MKRLNLRALELGANETLTRAQLKNVLGGVDPVTTNYNCAIYLPTGQGAPGSSYQTGPGGCTIGNKQANGTYSQTIVGVTQATALSVTNGVSGAHYCCSSCSTASWYQPCTPD